MNDRSILKREIVQSKEQKDLKSVILQCCTLQLPDLEVIGIGGTKTTTSKATQFNIDESFNNTALAKFVSS